MLQKEIEIIINPDGTLEVEQFGWTGQQCDGAVDDLIKTLGKVTRKQKKNEYHKKVKINNKLKQKN